MYTCDVGGAHSDVPHEGGCTRHTRVMSRLSVTWSVNGRVALSLGAELSSP